MKNLSIIIGVIAVLGVVVIIVGGSSKNITTTSTSATARGGLAPTLTEVGGFISAIWL
jgi:hypothetical protein